MITAERLRELLHYDPETGVFVRRVSRCGRGARAGAVAGHIHTKGYQSKSAFPPTQAQGLAQLRTSSPFKLEITYVGALRCSGYAVEAEAHRTLAGYRQNGEWFNCPVDMAVAAIGAAAYRMGEPLASGDPRLADEAVRIAAATNDMAAAPRPWLLLRIALGAALAIVKGVAAIVLAAVAGFRFYLIAVIVTGAL